MTEGCTSSFFILHFSFPPHVSVTGSISSNGLDDRQQPKVADVSQAVRHQ